MRYANGFLYHRCGFHVWAQTEWNGQRYVRRYYRPYETRPSRALTECPECGASLMATPADGEWTREPPEPGDATLAGEATGGTPMPGFEGVGS